MSHNFIPCDRDQIMLLPPDIREWVGDGELVWFVIATMEHMDKSEFYKGYREDGKGNTAFELSMMATLVVYAYSNGELSSRRIEKLCRLDVAFRVITANQKPDHTTISRFRKDNKVALEKLFVEVLKLCKKADMVKLGIVALDGTKMAGNASLSANRTNEALTEEVKKILKKAEEKDAEEDARYGIDKRGDELPKELTDPRSRYARLKECKARLDDVCFLRVALQN